MNNIPNILTLFRLLLVPVFAWLVLAAGDWWTAAGVFVLAGVTDVLDGYIARRWDMVTDVGKVFDPLADKLMQVAAVVCLYLREMLPAWVLALIVVKECTMISVSVYMFVKKTVTYSDWYGKAATVVFYGVVLLLMLFGGDQPHSAYAVILAVCAVFPGLGYLIRLIKKGRTNNE